MCVCIARARCPCAIDDNWKGNNEKYWIYNSPHIQQDPGSHTQGKHSQSHQIVRYIYIFILWNYIDMLHSRKRKLYICSARMASVYLVWATRAKLVFWRCSAPFVARKYILSIGCFGKSCVSVCWDDNWLYIYLASSQIGPAIGVFDLYSSP